MTLIVFLFNLSSVFLLLKQTNLLLESEKAKNEKNLVTVVTHFQNLGVSTLEKGGLRRHDSGLHVFQCVSCKGRLLIYFRHINRTRVEVTGDRVHIPMKTSTVYQNCNGVITQKFSCHLVREPKSTCRGYFTMKPCAAWEIELGDL